MIVFARMTKMIELAGGVLEIPRRCGRQRNYAPAETPKEYYRLAVYLPFLDSLIMDIRVDYSNI